MKDLSVGRLNNENDIRQAIQTIITYVNALARQVDAIQADLDALKSKELSEGA